MISPCLCNVYLHRLADDLVMMCQSQEEAEHALEALRAILSELGLTLKEAKTRIVELREGGEELDFLGFHHRWVRRNTPASRHLCFLARSAAASITGAAGSSAQRPKPRTLKCRKGFKKKMVRGKRKCVKVKKAPRKRRRGDR